LSWIVFGLPKKPVISLEPNLPEYKFRESSPKGGNLAFFCCLEGTEGVPVLEQDVGFLWELEGETQGQLPDFLGVDTT
jgi:hypothetical protein